MAIGEAIEAELGNRQGQRTDKEPVENFPQVAPGEKTRDLAAKAAGFGNGKTYEQAKKVANEAAPSSERAPARASNPTLGPAGVWRRAGPDNPPIPIGTPYGLGPSGWGRL